MPTVTSGEERNYKSIHPYSTAITSKYIIFVIVLRCIVWRVLKQCSGRILKRESSALWLYSQRCSTWTLFEPFLFEELPAINKSAIQVYLPEVEHCDIFLGLLGNSYGNEDAQGISPTEREFDAATVNGKHRIIFIKKSLHDARQPKEQTFIKKSRKFSCPKIISWFWRVKECGLCCIGTLSGRERISKNASFRRYQ